MADVTTGNTTGAASDADFNDIIDNESYEEITATFGLNGMQMDITENNNTTHNSVPLATTTTNTTTRK